MGKAAREADKRHRAKLRRKKLIRNILIAVGVVAVIAGIVVAVNVANRANTVSQELNVPLSADGSLRVARSALGDGFNYVDWGGGEELILYTNADGTVGAAFDACEECYPLGNVHFTRDGDVMTCGVCGTTAATSGFGAQSWGGCQPIAIPAAGRQDTESEIVVSAEAMDYAVDMFAQWDAGDMSVTLEGFAEA